MNFEFGGSPTKMQSGIKYVDLAELSLSGSLVPSVPTKLALRFDPPMMTIVYHFEKSSNDMFYHEIGLDKLFL